MALDNGNVLVHTALGLAALFSGEVEQGLAELRRAAELRPHNLIVLTLLANYLANQGEFELALSLTRRVIELNPHPPSWVAYPMFADHYLHGRYDAALELARQDLMGSGDFRDPLFLAPRSGSSAGPTKPRPRSATCVRPGSRLIERHAFSALFTDELIEGLEQAGLDEPDSRR
ncbi:MAG TPA: hypothetical protein VD788_07820 [Candidatus Polarisedimenticolaceae bacterium]|nr:hypothetical protein [Candidatus Polarisedimenticolaceae bacterium]